MNKYLRAVLAGCALATAVFPISVNATPKGGKSAAHATGLFQSEMDGSMAEMDRAMMSAPMDGTPDHDFAAMMIPHHKGALAMARAELCYGKNTVLRRLAEEIIITQQQEILVMERQIAATPRTASFGTSHRSALLIPALDLGNARFLRVTQGAANVGAVTAAMPVSGRDRVYSGDQTSNTVSVIDPATNTLLGIIRLGDPAPGAIQPLYKGQLLVHGLGFSPDHKTLDVISIGSNAVTLIDTATNAVKGTIYVGRSPHEGFFTPNGKELWVAVRGEDYISVIDPVLMKETRRIQTANGPGMVLFSPDGRYAYVPSSFTPQLDVVDTRSYRVIARVPQASPFSPNLAVSSDGAQVWFTLKDTGKTQVMSARPPFRILATLDTGPITNHVTTVDNAHGHFAYVTVGGLNEVKVFSRQSPFPLVATIPTGELPHGIWHSGDDARVYVGMENGDSVEAIDTLTNTVIATVPVGQTPQAVVYVPDAVPTGPGTDGLMPLGQAGQAIHLTLGLPAGESGPARASVAINSLGLVDLLEIAAAGLVPGRQYQLALVDSPTAPYGNRVPLTNFKANASGAGIAQAIGPLRQAVTDAAGAANPSLPRYLVLSLVGSENPVLVQRP